MTNSGRKNFRMLLLSNINNILNKMFNIEKNINLRVNLIHIQKLVSLYY
jgi:hypothetical protein